MDQLLGYLVGSPHRFFGAEPPLNYRGIGDYCMWPLSEEENRRFKVSLSPEQQDAFLIAGALPHDILVNGLVQSLDYVKAYQAYCHHLHKETAVFALSRGKISCESLPCISDAEFLGFDCLGSHGLSSYLYWDKGWTSFQKEISLQQIHFNQNQLFQTEEDALKYASMRRKLLEQGVDIEELGEEIVVGVTKVFLCSGP